MVSLQSMLMLVIFSLSIQRVSACWSSPNSGMMEVVVREKSECNGSLHLISTERNVTLYTINTIDIEYENLGEPITISRAKTQGCGCFIIYRRRDGRGVSKTLPKHHTFRADFRVSSFKRIECN